ncbi:rhomboid family intramembrane serine protease [Arthrobacter agilis]|uniref:rhomboid family intramembrane serine protease n=1 Tax=Arthrobacter agilis TaxID=37921 RepID=UPI000B35F369|nr:rhomboid family intramembrane serine protease [Arthrobacter agilis]OUM40537.1 rhomboid family intramembrane serine protease [Arthrobacter agilis]PPB45149.1 rhomboid family intramembrane serine protease [Arthrobacter agilis]TPV27848.1 rhomboid family intramembrane serine protease [Arthrobacter agilis]VDR31483.1 rhombosortase [Arthrobacter agilis]
MSPLAHRAQAGLITVVGLVALMWAVFLLNALLGNTLVASLGIDPRRVDGLDGVVFAPLLHSGAEHLVSNSLPLLVLGFVAFLDGARRFAVALGVSWAASGVGTWLFGGGLTIGASGVVFGLFTYLITRGFYNRDWRQILLAVVLFAAYGSILWGVLPTVGSNISWQAHLFGALGGVLAAFLLKRRRSAPVGTDRRRSGRDL